MRNVLRLTIVSLISSWTHSAYADLFSGFAERVGSSFSRLEEGLSAGRGKTVANNYYSNMGGGGQTAHNVNLWTGQPAYSVPIGSIQARAAIRFDLALNYGGPIKPIWESDNAKAPAGWVGIGFSLQFPFVAVNHKGSATSMDDVYFCNLGPLGGGQLLQAADNKFYLATNPAIKVEPLYDGNITSPTWGQVLSWTFTSPDGSKLVLGNSASARRTQAYTIGSIQYSSAAVSPKPFIYRWDISTLGDNAGKNVIEFSWQPIVEVGYVRESYPSEILVKGVNGAVAESWKFVLATQQDDEYVGDGSADPKSDQRPYETRYLREIQHYQEGALDRALVFNYRILAGDFTKRALDYIALLNRPASGSTLLRERYRWTFGYTAGSDVLLTRVDKPNGGYDQFTYGSSVLGAQARQDGAVYRMRRGNGAEIELPTDPSKWKNLSHCDERFCYLIAKQGAPAESTFIEVVHNTATRFRHQVFKTAAWVNPVHYNANRDGIQVLPYGDDFLVINKFLATITVYSWNGSTFVEQPRRALQFTAALGSANGIEVFPGPNFFVVWQRGIPRYINGGPQYTIDESRSQVHVFYKNPATGNFEGPSLGNAQACEMNNTNAFGEPVKADTDPCMTFNADSWDDLYISVGENVFTVTHREKGIIFAYTRAADGKTFALLAQDKFPNMADGSQRGTFYNNFDRDMYRTEMSGDYFLVHQAWNVSAATGQVGWKQERVVMWHFDGARFHNIGTSPSQAYTSDHPAMEFFVDRDYFVQANYLDRKLVYWKKQRASTPSGLSFTATNLNTALEWKSSVDLLVRTYPNLFTVEYYPNDALKTGIPSVSPLGGSDANFRSFIYRVDKLAAPVQLPGNYFVDASGKRLFNVTYSRLDGMLLGKSALNATGGICSQGCNITFYTGRHLAYPRAAPATARDVAHVPFNQVFTAQNTHMAISAAGRIGMLAVLDKTSRRALYQVYQYNGRNFQELSTTPNVVTQVTHNAGLDEDDRNRVRHSFSYAAGIAELNLHSLVPNFAACSVSTPGQGSATVVHVTDFDGQLLPHREMYGLVAASRTYATSGLPLSLAENELGLYRRSPAPAWPAQLRVARLLATRTTEYDFKGNKLTTRKSLHNYNDFNGLPRYVLDERKAPQDYVLQETIFDSQNMPSQQIVFRPGAKPVTGTSDPQSLDIRTGSTPWPGGPAVSSQKTVYENFLLKSDAAWRDTDPAMTPAQMIAAATPAFDLNRGWIPGTEVTARNGFNQPLEAKTLRHAEAGGARHTSYFYEGIRSDLAGTIANARRDNCAVLTAENGSLSLATHDVEGRWAKAGSAVTSEFAHTGRFSIKVTDNYGPTLNLTLKDVNALKFDFLVSAWIMSTGETSPALTVERRRMDGTVRPTPFMSIRLLQPEGANALTAGKWQRWEAHIKYSDLVEGGLFADNAGDYLRIWIGTGAPSGNPSKVLYVDDIVCRPMNSSFTLATYDYRGLPISSTDEFHQVRYYQRNSLGEVTAELDADRKAFGQIGRNRMGEN